MKSLSIATMLGLAMLPASASANELGDIGQACEAAIAAEDTPRVTELAAIFVDARGFITPKVAKLGESCLNAATRNEWVYSPEFSRFVTRSVLEARASLRKTEQELVAEADALDRDSAGMSGEAEDVLAEARDRNRAAITSLQAARDVRVAARAEEVRARTLVACETLRAADEIAALTNPVCHAIYIANGLPQD